MAEEPEVETGAVEAQDVQPMTPGAKLRTAREAQGLSIQDVATRTRIAQRQLEAVERDDYAALPGIPYAVGFARAYARTVGVDEVMIAAEVRNGVHGSDLGANRYEAFEPVDPARVPSRALAWTAAVIVILLIAGFMVWRTQMFTPPTSEEIAAQDQAAPATAARPAGATPVAPVVQTVVFTAVDDVWLRIYDEAGERLKDGLMKKGESFTLPANARNPMILTGRPQALTVTVGGKPMPPLGAADRTIADVPVSAEALLARGAAAGQPAAGGAPVPAPAQPAPQPGAN
jgi:cytoskeletal protein RodZ